MKSAAYRIWRFLLAWLVHIIFFVIPHGRKNEPDIKDGPYLLCANHIAATDPIVICDSVKKQQPRYMAKKELFSVPVLGRIISSLGAYPVDRAGRDAGVLVKTVKMLEDGYSVGIRYDYNLSKRTMVYSGIVALWNEKNAMRSIEAGPDSSWHAATTKPGHDVQQFFFGINHKF